MARKFQTYARPSTTNTATERRGYNFLYVEFPMFYQKNSGIMINLPFRRGNHLHEILIPSAVSLRKGRDAKSAFDFAQDDNYWRVSDAARR